VSDADRLANVIRQAVARFRIDNAAKLGLTAAQARMLSRLLIGPEFMNHLGGEGQTVSMLGALPVSKHSPAVEAEQQPEPAQPDLAERAARIAAQVADLVLADLAVADPVVAAPQPAPRLRDEPTVNLTERARALRRSASRLAGKSARGRVAVRRNPDRELGGVTTRGNRGA
jgi:hypothetical protein